MNYRDIWPLLHAAVKSKYYISLMDNDTSNNSYNRKKYLSICYWKVQILYTNTSSNPASKTTGNNTEMLFICSLKVSIVNRRKKKHAKAAKHTQREAQHAGFWQMHHCEWTAKTHISMKLHIERNCTEASCSVCVLCCFDFNQIFCRRTSCNQSSRWRRYPPWFHY